MREYPKEYTRVSEEVREALENGKPIVVMETAGTFEGISSPENLRCAQLAMETVRENGAVAAYTAVIEGVLVLGLEEADRKLLSEKRGTLFKATTRDLPMLIAQKKTALCSIGASIAIANLFGIDVVTGGGMGGVHRGAETTMDISADLEELAHNRVIVVCSGAKPILDLPKTLEYLETKGVAVIGFGTDELPAYMSRSCGLRLDCRMDDITEIAESFRIKKAYGLPGGMLVANPISEAYAIPYEQLNAAIEQAVEESIRDHVTGKRITAYLMNRVKELMGADSQEAQEQLLLGNVALAAKIANQMNER